MSARNVVSTVWRDIFAIGFQKSPLFLTGGIARKFPQTIGDSINSLFKLEKNALNWSWQFPLALPLSTLLADAAGVAVSDVASAFNSIGGDFALGTDSLDDLLLDWMPLANTGTLFNVTPSTYPLASQRVAANAQITQPLATSLKLSITPHTVGHYTALPLAIAAMKNIFQAHSNLGGLYHILTPGYIWTDMILTKFSDVTEHPEEAPASAFQLDFQKPITTKNAATQEMSTLLTQFKNGTLVPLWGSLADLS